MSSYVASPCQRACGLDPKTGRCQGCLRTANEIFFWTSLKPAEQRKALRRFERHRAAQLRKKALRLEKLGLPVPEAKKLEPYWESSLAAPNETPPAEGEGSVAKRQMRKRS